MKKGVFPLYLTLLPPVPTLCYFHLISSIFKTTHNPRLSHYSQPAELEPSPPPVKVWLQEKKNYAGKNVGGFCAQVTFQTRRVSGWEFVACFSFARLMRPSGESRRSKILSCPGSGVNPLQRHRTQICKLAARCPSGIFGRQNPVSSHVISL